jgi:ABC-type ATPase with predicted acetyltransferase domain
MSKIETKTKSLLVITENEATFKMEAKDTKGNVKISFDDVGAKIPTYTEITFTQKELQEIVEFAQKQIKQTP